MRVRSACLAIVAVMVVVFGSVVTDAGARRPCGGLGCSPSPLIEGVPQDCRVSAFTVKVSVPSYARRFRRLVIRVDGRTVARGEARRHSLRVRCDLLSPGEHRVSASARYGHIRSSGSFKKSTTVLFTVLPPVEPPAPVAPAPPAR